MYQELPNAIAIVQDAYKQKHGIDPPSIPQSELDRAAVIPESEQATAQSRSLAIIRNLVTLYEKAGGQVSAGASASATVSLPSEESPPGSTKLSDLRGSTLENIKLPVLGAREQIPAGRASAAPFAKPQFCKTLALSDAGLRTDLPLGMVRVGGTFIPSGGLDDSRWPCLLLQIDGVERQSHSYLMLKSETPMGAYYECTTPVVVGPVGIGEQVKTLRLTNCTGEEVKFGVEANLGPRVAMQDSQPQRRLHSLSFPSRQGLSDEVDVETLRVLDDKGTEVGKVNRVVPTDTNGTFRNPTDENTTGFTYLVEVTSSGSSPVNVCVSSFTPAVCVV